MKKAGKVMLGAVVLAAVPALALAASPTHVHIYKPFNSAGKPVDHVTHTFFGSCLGGSDASARSDAWRCVIEGSSISDPCFSSPKAKGIVLCPVSGPWNNKVIKVNLRSKLPKGNTGKPSTHGLPWALTTTKGWKCRLDTGATRVVQGKRENYFCTGTKQALYGAPERSSEPWKIYVAGGQATRLRRKAEISSAWF